MCLDLTRYQKRISIEKCRAFVMRNLDLRNRKYDLWGCGDTIFTVHVHGCTLLRSFSPFDSTIFAEIGRRTQYLGSCVADFRITMIVKIRTKRLK